MRPEEALTTAVIVAVVIMAAWGDVIEAAIDGAIDHARAQAGAEFRRARQTVTGNVKEGLRSRLVKGAQSTPLRSGWWWAVAGLRTAGAVRRGMRGLRRGASGLRAASLPSAGPLRRVRDAAAAGARAGAKRASEARQARRADHRGLGDRLRQGARNATAWRPSRRRDRDAAEGLPTGVCDDCGVTAARTALQPVTREGPAGPETWIVCGACRAPSAVGTSAPDGAESIPAVSGEGSQAMAGLPALALVPGVMTTNGAPMSGALARRSAPSSMSASHSGGDLSTHGDWDRLSRLIAEALGITAQCQENMLGHLNTAEAGRTQIAQVRDWSDQVTATEQHIKNMIDSVNSRISPLIDAVAAAGGPAEVASPGYHSDY